MRPPPSLQRLLAAAAATLLWSSPAAAAASSAAKASTSVTLLVPPTAALPNPFSLAPGTHATLSSLGARYAAPLSAANAFVFRNVTPGSYLVDVHCATHFFAPLRLDVIVPVPADAGEAKAGSGGRLALRAWETYRGNEWENRGEAVPLTEYDGFEAFAVPALGAKNYFVERSKCESCYAGMQFSSRICGRE